MAARNNDTGKKPPAKTFTFVNTQHPDDNKKADNKRVVRSQAASKPRDRNQNTHNTVPNPSIPHNLPSAASAAPLPVSLPSPADNFYQYQDQPGPAIYGVTGNEQFGAPAYAYTAQNTYPSAASLSIRTAEGLSNDYTEGSTWGHAEGSALPNSAVANIHMKENNLNSAYSTSSSSYPIYNIHGSHRPMYSTGESSEAIKGLASSQNASDAATPATSPPREDFPPSQRGSHPRLDKPQMRTRKREVTVERQLPGNQKVSRPSRRSPKQPKAPQHQDSEAVDFQTVPTAHPGDSGAEDAGQEPVSEFDNEAVFELEPDPLMAGVYAAMAGESCLSSPGSQVTLRALTPRQPEEEEDEDERVKLLRLWLQPGEMSASGMSQLGRLGCPRLLSGGMMKLFIEYYIHDLAVSLPELDLGIVGSLREIWIPIAASSPALVAITLLAAASHWAVAKKIHRRPLVREVLCHLKGAAITALRVETQALGAKSKASDTHITAVCKMAMYASMFENGDHFHDHMRAVQLMVQTRGGLENLGSNGFLSRMIQWIDIGAAFNLNHNPYMSPMIPLMGNVSVENVPLSGQTMAQYERRLRDPVLAENLVGQDGWHGSPALQMWTGNYDC